MYKHSLGLLVFSLVLNFSVQSCEEGTVPSVDHFALLYQQFIDADKEAREHEGQMIYLPEVSKAYITVLFKAVVCGDKVLSALEAANKDETVIGFEYIEAVDKDSAKDLYVFYEKLCAKYTKLCDVLLDRYCNFIITQFLPGQVVLSWKYFLEVKGIAPDSDKQDDLRARDTWIINAAAAVEKAAQNKEFSYLIGDIEEVLLEKTLERSVSVQSAMNEQGLGFKSLALGDPEFDC